MTSFFDLLRPVSRSEALRAEILPEFLQGRAAFGGLVGALCVRALRACVADDRPLRSVTMSFVAPAGVGEVEIEPRVLREGGAATQAQATLRQNGAVCAVALASFGAPRNANLAIVPAMAPAQSPPETYEPVPFIPGLTPEFTQHFEYRWPEEVMPFMGKGRGTMPGWMRLRADIPPSESFLVALGDAWPTPVLPMLTELGVISTLSWSLEICGPAPMQPSDHWWQVQAVAELAADSYVHQETRFWTREGNLALVGRQVVAVFSAGQGKTA
jgi:acyl-CoA thioesterase